MSYYIVRIYRREGDDGLVGLVEDVTQSTRIPFRNRDELWSALCRTESAVSGGRARRAPPKGAKIKSG